MITVDLELVRKYNVPGPRYTSYPTAVQFEDKTWNDIAPLIARDAESRRPLSLYVHLPFCETLCWFCGCTVVIKKGGDAGTYLDTVEKELACWKSRMGDRPVVQVHYGGGTPTYLKPDQIRRLGDALRTGFNFADELEYSVEVDPRRLSRDHMRALRESGTNRISMGVQDFSEDVQKAINRIQPFEMTRDVVDWARAEGIGSVNVDLIYGLPGQTEEGFERTIDLTLSLAPERIVTFSYAHVPWMKRQQKILDKAGLPSAETKLQLLKRTIEKLTAAGYVYIGLDHFAKADDELAVAQQRGELQRNFQGYSTRGGTSIYAFGMSGISQTDDVYFQNAKDLGKYTTAVEAGLIPVERGYILNYDDKIRRAVIMQILCNLTLSYERMSRELNIDFRAYFAKELASLGDMERDGLLRLSPEGIDVTDQGRLFIRNIAMAFDAHRRTGDQTFSKTV